MGITIQSAGGGLDEFTPASASAAASLDFAEDTDNGTNKITVTAPAAIASDKTLTLPDATDTLVGKATTDTLTNKTLTTPTMTGPIVTTSYMDLQVGQIKFPASANASADANTLDDYEEGTTTPTVTPDSGSITTSSCTVTYTKQGRQVGWSAVVTITDKGTGAGAINIPLPFTAASAAPASAREVSVTGVAGAASIGAATAVCRLVKYDNATFIVSGYIISVGGTYSV